MASRAQEERKREGGREGRREGGREHGVGMARTVEHVPLSARKPPPIRENHEGQVLSVEVSDRLCGLVGGVREPDPARLLDVPGREGGREGGRV
jgi:hypothetical protein